ncbi:Fur family transcriptional regulator [Hymenobacter persicinus]|uniref:Transcriptional repressor n=1 Tax=Hymenobacter persicinus TaxID=2025506 RepID=A0A4Q5L880_9BACT|nr:transcriptional repressor [Hymenobacter persicinus]RYU77848.1 transcriptional repressor [Hymenobacter persicinus]
MADSRERIALMLNRHGLRQTAARVQVLQTLHESEFALSGAEIEKTLGQDLDRITLYRTLRSFEEKGLVHRVLDASDVARYASCSLECSEHAHFDNHVHFKCTACTHIYCLNQIAIPAVALPREFQAVSRDYLLSGVCSHCQPAQ